MQQINTLQADCTEDTYQDLEMEAVNQPDLPSTPLFKPQAVPKVKSALKSKALRWHMPIIGEVPMSK